MMVRGMPSASPLTPSFAFSVFAVRDPIDRFVSAVGEVLQRVVNGICPGGGQCPPIEEGQLRESTGYALDTMADLEVREGDLERTLGRGITARSLALEVAMNLKENLILLFL